MLHLWWKSSDSYNYLCLYWKHRYIGTVSVCQIKGLCRLSALGSWGKAARKDKDTKVSSSALHRFLHSAAYDPSEPDMVPVSFYLIYANDYFLLPHTSEFVWLLSELQNISDFHRSLQEQNSSWLFFAVYLFRCLFLFIYFLKLSLSFLSVFFCMTGL